MAEQDSWQEMRFGNGGQPAHMDLQPVNKECECLSTVRVQAVYHGGMTTFAYKYNTNPQGRVGGRDAHKDTMELSIA